MPRLIYNAHALARAVFLHKPLATPVADHCACVLPSAGGRVTTRTGAQRLSDPSRRRLLMGYDAAECSAAGIETGNGERRTKLRVMVTGLHVLVVLRAEEIVANLSVAQSRNALCGLTPAPTASRGCQSQAARWESRWRMI